MYPRLRVALRVEWFVERYFHLLDVVENQRMHQYAELYRRESTTAIRRHLPAILSPDRVGLVQHSKDRNLLFVCSAHYRSILRYIPLNTPVKLTEELLPEKAMEVYCLG